MGWSPVQAAARHLESLFQAEQPADGRVRRVLRRLGKLVYMTARKMSRDLVFERAASLSFTTTVTFVPLSLLVFSFFAAIGTDGILSGAAGEFSRAVDELKESIVGYVSEESEGEVRDIVEQVESSIQRQASNVQRLALVILVFTVLSLFRSAERSFSVIWNVARQRGYLRRLATFWLLLTLAPLILGTSVYVKSTLEENLGVQDVESPASEAGETDVPVGDPQQSTPSEEPWGEWLAREALLNWIFPISISFFAFTLLFVYLPNTRVRVNAAAVGGLGAAFGWELGTQGFSLYLEHAFLTGVYGALGVVPFFLFWVYFSWLVALIGSEVSYCLQNFSVLEQEVRYHIEEERIAKPIHGLLFLERVYRGFRGDAHVATTHLLASEFCVPLSEAENIVERLHAAEYVVIDADGILTPRWTAERVRPLDVVNCFPTGTGFRLPSLQDLADSAAAAQSSQVTAGTQRLGPAGSSQGRSPEPVTSGLRSLLERLGARTEAELGGTSLADLLRAPSPPPSGEA